MKIYFVLWVALAGCLSFLFLADISSAAGTSSVKQTLKEKLSYEIRQIEAAKKGPPPESQLFIGRMQQREWQRELDGQKKKLLNLSALVDETTEEKLPDVLVVDFLEEEKHTDQYPPLEPYVLALGEQSIPAFEARYDQVGPRLKERVLLAVGNTRSRKALPLIRKALDDQNQRVILEAQTALRLVLNLEAKPELEKMLIATKSSWALGHTLREISLIGGKDWYEDFFRMARAGKISIRDLAMIGDPQDCPEDVIGENLDFLLKTVGMRQDPQIRPFDIYSAAEVLLLFMDAHGGKSPLWEELKGNFDPKALADLKGLADSTELTGEHELAIAAAFNKTKDDLALYPRNASRVVLNTPGVKGMFKNLLEQGVFVKEGEGWSVKAQLTADERASVMWFNIYLLNQEFPSVLNKDKNGSAEQRVARQMLSRLSQRVYLRQIYPLLTEIFGDRFRCGGKIESFGSSVISLPGKPAGFSDGEADLILKNIALNLLSEDIDEWLKKGSTGALTGIYLEDLLAQKKGEVLDLKDKVFSFRITAIAPSGRELASAAYQLKNHEEREIVLASEGQAFPEHKIKLKVWLDHEKWLFHVDLLIDLKPSGAGFDIYIPFAGANETPLTETINGEQQKILWRFEHVDQSQ